METDGSDALWRLTMEHSPVGMTLVGPDGRILTANAALCSILGYDEPTLLGLTFQDLTHPDDLDRDQELFDQLLAGERTSYRMVKRYYHADGSVVWGELSVALLRDDSGEPIHTIGQVVDVTAQHHAQDRLAEALATIETERRRVAAVFTTVDVGLLLLDTEGRYTTVNRRQAEFLALAYPEGHAGFAGQLGEVYAEDGVTLMTSEEMPTTRAVAGEELDDVRIWIGADPEARRALSVSARAVRTIDGVVVGAALAYTDVTDYLEALAVQDRFLATVSHELRTPLTSVLGHLELLVDDSDRWPELADQLHVVERNARRLTALVSDLLETAEGQDRDLRIRRSTTDLVGIVEEALAAVRPALDGAGLGLDAELPAALETHADPRRIRQVLDNLLSNAVKYSRRGGRVVVRLSAAPGTVELVVGDSGLGISPEDQERLFTPFFRGDEVRERAIAGTGLGLSIVRAIVEAHGGRIDVTSAPDAGSTFTVRLPR